MSISGGFRREGFEGSNGRVDPISPPDGEAFGPIPSWAEERLGKLTTRELEDLSLLLLDAGSLEELLEWRAAPLYSTASSTQPGRVAGLLLRNTIFRVFGNGRFVASARL